MPDEPQPSPAPAPAPAGDPAPVPAPAPAPAPAAPETPFYAGFEDATVKEWAEGKGWKSPEAVVKSAMNLEKMVGAPAEQVLRIPQEGDVEGWAKARQQLGAPAEATAYTVPGLGEDEASVAYGDVMRAAFHKAGLTQEQVDTIVGAGNEFVEGQESSREEDYKRTVEVQTRELQAEWGNGYERMMAIGRQASQRLGMTEEMISGMESAVGYAETIKFLSSLGERLGEDRYVEGNGNAALTPAQAKVAWETFKSDPNNIKALMNKGHAGHAAAMAKKQEIFAVMYPDMQGGQ